MKMRLIKTLDGEMIEIKRREKPFSSALIKGGKMRRPDILSWTWAAEGPHVIFLGGLFRTTGYRFRCSTKEVYSALLEVQPEQAEEIRMAYAHNNFENQLV